MTTRIRNRESLGLESILAKPAGPGSVRLIDYIAGSSSLNVNKDFLDQEHSYYVFGLDLYFKTTSAVNSDIIGYEVEVIPV